jgi:predicted DNA-binding ribbon-helix-helix protein
LLLECGSYLIPQEENFGRGDGLQREIQFWKTQANDIATRRFCTLKKLADDINFAR